MQSVSSAPDEPLVPDYVRLLWHGEAEARPGPRRGLDLSAIASAGVRVADAEGLGALSMRRLAAEVGLTTMGLYRYVQSKAEILALLVDRACGPPPVYPDDLVDWRSRLECWGQIYFQRLLEHPWALQVPVFEPPLAPNQVGWMEAGLTALAGVALSEQEKLSSMLVVDVFVRGQAQLSMSMAAAPEAQAMYSTRVLSLIDAAEFPHLMSALTSGALDDGDPDDFGRDSFAFGLDNVLDGIASRMARRGI